MGKLNWKRWTAKDRKEVSDYRRDAEWKTRCKYAVYRGGSFWIGDRFIERWNKKANPENGIFLRATTGKFEIWKKGKCLSRMPWRSNWNELIHWAEKYGFNTSNP